MIILSIITVIYVITYCINSICGGYWGYPVAGMWRLSNANLRTLFYWQPYFGYVDKYNITFCGVVWYPLIRVDQTYIHHSMDLFKQDDEERIFNDKNIKWHPKSVAAAESQRISKCEWRSHCFDDIEFCLQSAAEVHSKRDEHFIALLLYDALNTNTLSRLNEIRRSANSGFSARRVDRVMNEVRQIVELQRLISTQINITVVEETNRNMLNSNHYVSP